MAESPLFFGYSEEFWWIALDHWRPESLPCESCLAEWLGRGGEGKRGVSNQL